MNTQAINHLLSLLFLLPLATSFSFHASPSHTRNNLSYTARHHFEQAHLTSLLAATIDDVSVSVQQDGNDMPELGRDGIYHIMNDEQHRNFMESNKDKMVIVKVFAPWCKACQALSPKFLCISRETQFSGLPIVFAELTCQDNKDLIRAIGIQQIPSIQFYANGQVEETIPCKPSQVPAMKKMLTTFVNAQLNQLASSFPTNEFYQEDEYADELSIGESLNEGGLKWSLPNLFG